MAFILLLSLLNLLLVAGASAQECADVSEPMVFPYWSTCSQPAMYFTEETYELESADSQRPGKLAAICDDAATSSDCNVGLLLEEEAVAASRYNFTYISRELRDSVAQADDVILVNAESGRTLAWRQNSDGEEFLVEVADISNATRFQFSQRENIVLDCPRIADARCEAYSILSFSSSAGLTDTSIDGATYLKQSTENLLPFLLIRVTEPSSNSSP
ncbi:hypothetical protein KP509_20G028900 [Ceratopteris richardii]|uniref:Uncharacterized protein n=1 Tax=Ceratopteris richardii TaxID=49495 RepID=A0A8T2SHC1_CERRI|nr:hypothetical protein KP509_20G028900 [Ceratopteris richardii]